MENVTKLRCIHIPNTMDTPLKPLRFFYVQDGLEKYWDLVYRDSSIYVIIFNINKKCLIAIKHFHPAVYTSCIPYCEMFGEIDLKTYPLHLGISVDLCNTTVEETADLKKIARDIVLEKCGYNIKQDNIHKISYYRSGISLSSAHATMYYCIVTDADKAELHTIPEDIIEIVELTIPQIKNMFCVPAHQTITCTSDFLFGLQWLMYHYERGNFEQPKK